MWSICAFFLCLFYVSITGNTDFGPLNKLRTFLSYQHCREALSLAKGKTYLIMGSSADTHIEEDQQT